MYAENKKRAFKNESRLLKEGYKEISVKKDKSSIAQKYVILVVLMIIVLYVTSTFYLKNRSEFHSNFPLDTLEEVLFLCFSLVYSFLSILFHEGLHCMALGWDNSCLLSNTRSYGNKPVKKSRFLFSLLLPTVIHFIIFGILIFLSMCFYELIALFTLTFFLMINLMGASVDIDVFIFIVKTYQYRKVSINTCVKSGYILVKENANDTLSYEVGIKKPQTI